MEFNIVNTHPTRVPEFGVAEIKEVKCSCTISEREEIRRNILQKEKYDEKVGGITKSRLLKHCSIVKHGARLLAIISLLTFFAALYLIHLEAVNRKLKSPKFRVVTTR
ncbi:MAG TPA: hypothetical protein VGG71_14780 [Chitinophagaceae bacterium]